MRLLIALGFGYFGFSALSVFSTLLADELNQDRAFEVSRRAMHVLLWPVGHGERLLDPWARSALRKGKGPGAFNTMLVALGVAMGVIVFSLVRTPVLFSWMSTIVMPIGIGLFSFLTGLAGLQYLSSGRPRILWFWEYPTETGNLGWTAQSRLRTEGFLALLSWGPVEGIPPESADVNFLGPAHPRVSGGDDWQSVVLGLLDQAELAVVQGGKGSRNLVWELQQAGAVLGADRVAIINHGSLRPSVGNPVHQAPEGTRAERLQIIEGLSAFAEDEIGEPPPRRHLVRDLSAKLVSFGLMTMFAILAIVGIGAGLGALLWL